MKVEEAKMRFPKETGYTVKLDWFGLVSDVKSHFIFILETIFVLVVNEFFSSPHNGLKKCLRSEN